MIDLELGSDHSGTNFHLQRALDGREDRRNVIHRRISRSRKHAMQTFGRLVKLTVSLKFRGGAMLTCPSQGRAVSSNDVSY